MKRSKIIKKLAKGKLVIIIDCNKQKRLRKILKKAFPYDKSSTKIAFKEVFLEISSFDARVYRCDIYNDMWTMASFTPLGYDIINLSNI